MTEHDSFDDLFTNIAQKFHVGHARFGLVVDQVAREQVSMRRVLSRMTCSSESHLRQRRRHALPHDTYPYAMRSALDEIREEIMDLHREGILQFG